MSSSSAEQSAAEAMFAAGYAARAVDRYHETADAEQRVLNEQIDEAYVRIRMGLPARDQYERARYSEWAVRIGMGVSPAALGPGGPERRTGFLAAAARREEQYEASRAWGSGLVGERAPLLYPEDHAVNHRSHEAVARLQAQLPPRTDFECETYRRWAETDPQARHARDSAISRDEEWHPSRWEITMLEEACGPSPQAQRLLGNEREAAALAQIRAARLRDRELDAGLEPPF